MGHLSARDYMKWTLGRAPLLGNPKDEVYEKYAKCPVNRPSSLQGPCWGTRRGVVCQNF